MSWKKRAERAYHHGNLREALIQAARDLIKEKGPAGFTFADAARSAGVSPAAMVSAAPLRKSRLVTPRMRLPEPPHQGPYHS